MKREGVSGKWEKGNIWWEIHLSRFNDKLFQELCQCHHLCVCVVYWSPAILHASRTVPSFKFLQPKQAQHMGEGHLASSLTPRVILTHHCWFSSSGKRASSIFYQRRCPSGFWSHRPLSKGDEDPWERQISKDGGVLGVDVWVHSAKCLRHCRDWIFTASSSKSHAVSFCMQISLCWLTALTVSTEVIGALF